MIKRKNDKLLTYTTISCTKFRSPNWFRVCIKTHAYISTLKGYLILHSFLGRRGRGFTIGKIFPVLLIYDKWAGSDW